MRFSNCNSSIEPPDDRKIQSPLRKASEALYKHIIFDFDGTLVDSLRAALEIYNRLAEEMGLNPVTSDDYRRLQQASMKERFKIMGIPRYRIGLIRKLFHQFHERYQEHLGAIHLWGGIKELLARLEELGYTVSVITSNSAENVARFFTKRGIVINGAIRSAHGVFGKRQALQKYLRDQRLKKHAILYVGDELRDVITCRKARIDIAAVTWGFDQKATLEAAGPRYVLDHPAQLLEFLDG
jgi:phosphoglycolate phosphatase